MPRKSKTNTPVAPAPKASATLKIDIWTEPGGELPEDLSEAYAEHVEHVARLCREGYTSGEIVDDNFSGWWSVKETTEG